MSETARSPEATTGASASERGLGAALRGAASGLSVPGLHGALREALERRWPGASFFHGRILTSLLSFVPYLFLGQTWLLVAWIVRRVAIEPSAPMPDFESVATVPGRYVAFHALFLVVLWIPRRWQVRAAALGALGLGIGAGIVDVASVAALGVFALAFWGVFRLPIPRWAMLAGIVVGVPAVRTLGETMGWDAVARPSLSTGLIVVLWYACYHVTTGKAIGLLHYIGYVKTRLFMEGPVFTIPDFTRAPEKKIAATRMHGVEALVIAMFSRSLSHHIAQLLEAGSWATAQGVALLGYSYAHYLGVAFGLVASYNLYLGLLRLFGLPIRDNFNWWILARTPNEHWKRWNLLLREWLITFTFYPMMRARIPLFVSIMATLLVSGLLHVFAHVGTAPLDFERAAITMLYWTVNGLAIYVVVAVPRAKPQLVERFGFRERRAWWVAGWLATSAFYAVMVTMSHTSDNFGDVAAYLGRLVAL